MDSLYTRLDSDQVRVSAHDSVVEMGSVLLTRYPAFQEMSSCTEMLSQQTQRQGMCCHCLVCLAYKMCPGVWQEHVTILGDEEV